MSREEWMGWQVQRARGKHVLLMSGEQEGGDTDVCTLQKPTIK